VALAAVVIGVVTWALVHDSSYVAPPPGPSTAQEARPAQAAVALHALEDALAHGDEEAAAALAPAGDDQAAELLRSVAANSKALGMTPQLRYDDEAGGVAADGGWPADADLTWRYAGDEGTEPARAEVVVDFVPEGEDAVAISGFGSDDKGRVPVWLTGPVVVRRGPGVMAEVVGDGAAARSQATRYARLAGRAVDVVHKVLPHWHDRLVLEVPSSSAALDRALDAEPGHSAAVAAVTAPVDGSTTGGAPVHVFVNPEVFGGLRPTGALVVISHEAAHVATDAARSSMTPWLVEGFADYVALRDVDLPLETTTGQITRQVRRDGVPDALPAPSDFDTDTGHLGATYEGAWLACLLLAQTGGERALVALYDDVASGESLEAAVKHRFGLTVAEVTHRWQQRLSELAAA
jgi:hypothetical protein